MKTSRAQSSKHNRSLLRGLEILRAFRPGTDLLGNGELAERTGLPRATVSRLSSTLVAAGFLQHEAAAQAYRLAPPLLSLGLAAHMSAPLLALAHAPMREASSRLRANVGLATADRGEMIYLESVRYDRRVALRRVVAGQRIPIERTSLGRAYLFGLDDAARRTCLLDLQSRRAPAAPDYAGEIEAAFAALRQDGFCVASWLPGVTALATPIVLPGRPVHALNMSLTSEEPAPSVATRLGPALLRLADELRRLAADR